LKIDKNSADWRTVDAWLKDQINKQRDLLEDSTLTIEYTQFHRGFIAALRALENLPESEGSRVLSE